MLFLFFFIDLRTNDLLCVLRTWAHRKQTCEQLLPAPPADEEQKWGCLVEREETGQNCPTMSSLYSVTVARWDMNLQTNYGNYWAAAGGGAGGGARGGALLLQRLAISRSTDVINNTLDNQRIKWIHKTLNSSSFPHTWTFVDFLFFISWKNQSAVDPQFLSSPSDSSIDFF